MAICNVYVWKLEILSHCYFNLHAYFSDSFNILFIIQKQNVSNSEHTNLCELSNRE